MKLMIKETALEERSGPRLHEDYDPNWLDNANDEDLVLVRSELEEFDMHAERIYKAIKASPDRNNQTDINGLIQHLKKVNRNLDDIATAWEADIMSN